MAAAKTADSGAPENALESAEKTKPLSSRVRVRDTKTGEILPYPVPRSWLDGRFPNLQETHSSKAGK